MKKKLKIVLNIMLIFLFILFLIRIDLRDVYQQFKLINMNTILILLLLQLLIQLLVSYQWKLIMVMNGFNPKYSKLFTVVSKSSLVEVITPGTKVGGEVYKTYKFKENLESNYETSLSLVLAQKVISISILVLLSLLSILILFSNQSIRVPFTFNIIYWIIGFSIGSILLIILLSKFKFFMKVKNYIDKFRQVLLNLFKNRNDFIKLIVVTLIIWLLLPLRLTIVLNSFGVHHSFAFSLIITFTSLIMGTFSIIPGGFGAFEFTMSSLIVLLLAVSNSTSLLIAGIYRLTSIWFLLLIGVVILIYEHIKKIKKKTT